MEHVTFLVVDDAIFMRTVLKKILTEAEFTVCGEAGNGLQAVEMAAELQPDIVTLDITMPEMNGIEAIEKIENEKIMIPIIPNLEKGLTFEKVMPRKML